MVIRMPMTYNSWMPTPLDYLAGPSQPSLALQGLPPRGDDRVCRDKVEARSSNRSPTEMDHARLQTAGTTDNVVAVYSALPAAHLSRSHTKIVNAAFHIFHM